MEEQQRAYYGEYFTYLLTLEQQMQEWLNDLTQAICDDGHEAAVEHIRSRIKHAAGLQEKLRRKGKPTDVNTALSCISDILGFRLVTHFVGEVYSMAQAIRQSGRYEVVKEKDYIAHPKDNGYRSYHMILQCPFAQSPQGNLRVEIQIRTIAMDCWASLEHEMRYKKQIANPLLIEKELKRCADEMASTDLSMQTLRDMIHADES